MNILSPQETIVLGTAIAFELAKNKNCVEIRQISALLAEVLHTLEQLAR